MYSRLWLRENASVQTIGLANLVEVSLGVKSTVDEGIHTDLPRGEEGSGSIGWKFGGDGGNDELSGVARRRLDSEEVGIGKVRKKVLNGEKKR